MDEKAFKKTNKPPACTRAPWDHLVTGQNKDNILRAIRQETIAIYGYAMDECPKRKVCFTKTCIGRPLPWKSATAKPYLDKLKTTHNIVNDELFLDNCGTCPIALYCTSSCSQVNDYLQRDKTEEPEIVYKDSLDNVVSEERNEDALSNILGKGLIIPWDCLTPRREQVVKKYVYDQKDFLSVAKELGLYDQAKAKYEFYAALTKLGEYAVMRKWLKDNEPENWFVKSDSDSRNYGILHDIYNENKTLTQVATDCGISKQAVQQIVSRVMKANNISWTQFVRKEKNKVIYSVPEVLR